MTSDEADGVPDGARRIGLPGQGPRGTPRCAVLRDLRGMAHPIAVSFGGKTLSLRKRSPRKLSLAISQRTIGGEVVPLSEAPARDPSPEGTKPHLVCGLRTRFPCRRP